MSTHSQEPTVAPVTVATLLALKQKGERIAMLTAYDASFARVVDAAGVEVILVGDSLGMVLQGQDTTLPVTMDDMVYHTRCVARGRRRALLIADMPFMSYPDPGTAMRNAARLMQEGQAQMVKLEGGSAQVETTRRLTEQGIPVCAHLGLQPQSVHKLGGYRVQGRDAQAARAIIEDAVALEQAGAALLVLECIPRLLAAEVTAQLRIPTIGIGAGARCDGQVLVLHDLLGVSPGRRPKFTRDFLTGNADGVAGAVRAYVTAVKQGSFPGDEHGFD